MHLSSGTRHPTAFLSCAAFLFAIGASAAPAWAQDAVPPGYSPGDPPAPAYPPGSPYPPAVAYPAAVPYPPAYVLPPLSPEVRSRWHTGSGLYLAGSIINLVGGGLSLSGVVAAGVSGASTTTQVLIYSGSGLGALGFILTSTGLVYEHGALDRAGVDPGRGLFAASTTLGVLGFLGVGSAYFLALSNYPTDFSGNQRNVVALSTAVGGTVLLYIADFLHVADAIRMGRIYRRLGTF